MPYGRRRMNGTITRRLKHRTPTRYRYTVGRVLHNGNMYRQRLGFRGNTVVEVALIPAKMRKR